MAGVPVRTPFQPRTKAHTILNTTTPSTETIATSNPPLRSNAPAASINRKLSTDADAISDRSTLLFIRRTLCSHLSEKGRSTPAPIDEILPPLTSSNEVDLQLYALIAIIIREFVHTWYAKITPDQMFVEEVVKIIAHCTRALEQRLRKVDLESLLFEELPDLLDTHVKIYKMSHYPLHPEPISVNPRQVYHSLWPFAPLSPVPLDEDPDTIKSQSNNEAAYRQLIINGVLAVLLPTEDLENDCLTSLVGQIFSEMILGNGIGGKACEPWLLWEGIMKIAEVIQARLPKAKAQVRIDRSNSEITRPNLLDIKAGNTKTSNFGKSMQKYFWLILQYLFLAFAAVRAIFIAIATSSSLPSRIPPTRKPTGFTLPSDDSEPPMNSEALPWTRAQPLKRPILKMKLWSCVSTLLDMDTRMPWLSATLSLLQWGAITGPGRIGDTDGMIDKPTPLPPNSHPHLRPHSATIPPLHPSPNTLPQ
ncbi:similar to PXA domain-containing protein [Botrytis cinerea T4]|uniref:Similar to PXA domain-containing protein n=1 Tax=Botryotinia fuckeliana (strain T4) TaxID=999810 RepID=G2YD03_BOTF4|nr:similar to PXA domain-containing protein [Botrytis cinerea T4]